MVCLDHILLIHLIYDQQLWFRFRKKKMRIRLLSKLKLDTAFTVLDGTFDYKQLPGGKAAEAQKYIQEAAELIRKHFVA
jgi:hypothetical protein